MRIVGVRLSPQGETFVAELHDDDGPARILAPLAAFWAAPAAALSAPGEGAATVPVPELVIVPPVPLDARVMCVARGPDGELRFAARWVASLAVSGSAVPVPADYEGLSWVAGIAAYVGAVLVDATTETAGAAILGRSTFVDLAAVRLAGVEHAVLAGNGDSTGPLGPLVIRKPGDEREDALRVTVRIDDRVVVDREVRGTRATLAAAVSLASRHLTLRPGDLVVLRLGDSVVAEPLLRPGAVVEVDVDSLGAVRNSVIGDARRSAVFEPH